MGWNILLSCLLVFDFSPPCSSYPCLLLSLAKAGPHSGHGGADGAGEILGPGILLGKEVEPEQASPGWDWDGL